MGTSQAVLIRPLTSGNLYPPWLGVDGQEMGGEKPLQVCFLPSLMLHFGSNERTL